MSKCMFTYYVIYISLKDIIVCILILHNYNIYIYIYMYDIDVDMDIQYDHYFFSHAYLCVNCY